MFKLLFFVALIVFLITSFVHQEQVYVDPECNLDSPGPLCTSSGTQYDFYWKPFWK